MRLGPVHFPVADLRRSIAFYPDALGLRIGFEIEGNMAAVDDIALVLDQAGHDPHITAAAVAIEVADVDAAYAASTAKGVTPPEEPKTRPWGSGTSTSPILTTISLSSFSP